MSRRRTPGLVAVLLALAALVPAPAAQGAGAERLSAAAAESDVVGAGGVVSLPPARLLDTRTSAPVSGQGTLSLQVNGVGGIPASGVSAVVLNVTAVNPAAGGFLTAYPDGTARPNASNLNFVKGQVVPNLVMVKVGTNGKVAFYNGAPGATHLLVDVAGYVVGGTPAGAGSVTSLAPARLLDTRTGGGAVPALGTRSLQVAGLAGVPASGATAVVLNVTAVAPTQGGYVTAYPSGTARPNASNLNFVAGQVVPNLVVVKLGADGKVALFNGSPGTTHLLADVAGYVTGEPATAAGTVASLAPARLLDTRTGGGPVPALGTRTLQVTGAGGVPSDGVGAVVLNVTAVTPAQGGYLTAYPSGTARPNASNLNFTAGQVVPNLVVVKVGTDGKVALFNGSTGSTHLLVDVAGYIRPGRGADSFVPSPVPGVEVISDLVCTSADTCLGTATPLDRDFQESTPPRARLVSVAGEAVTVSDLPLPADAAPSRLASVYSIDCSDEGTCLGGGGYARADGAWAGLLVARTGGVWSARSVAAPSSTAGSYANVLQISCAPGGHCVAIVERGDSVQRETVAHELRAGVWSTSTVPAPFGAGSYYLLYHDLSCPALGRCVAVGVSETPESGIQLVTSSLTAGGWSTSAQLLVTDEEMRSYPTAALDCISATSCVVAIGYSTMEAGVSLLGTGGASGSWTLADGAVPAATLAYFSEIDCLPGGTCAAVGSAYEYDTGRYSPLVRRFASGSWSAETAPVVRPGDGGQLVDVDCVDATRCVAVGDGESGGVAAVRGTSGWTVSPIRPGGSDVASGMTAVSCPATGSCVLAGFTDDFTLARAFLAR